MISLTYKDLAGLSKADKGGESIDKATFLQNFPVPGLVGGGRCTLTTCTILPKCKLCMSRVCILIENVSNLDAQNLQHNTGTDVLTAAVLCSSCETDRLFHALDSNKSGRISFDDFVVGLAVCCRGSLEEKMRFLFGVYDMNEVLKDTTRVCVV